MNKCTIIRHLFGPCFQYFPPPGPPPRLLKLSDGGADSFLSCLAPLPLVGEETPEELPEELLLLADVAAVMDSARLLFLGRFVVDFCFGFASAAAAAAASSSSPAIP